MGPETSVVLNVGLTAVQVQSLLSLLDSCGTLPDTLSPLRISLNRAATPQVFTRVLSHHPNGTGMYVRVLFTPHS